jgi:hypothetical protein
MMREVNMGSGVLKVSGVLVEVEVSGEFQYNTIIPYLSSKSKGG